MPDTDVKTRRIFFAVVPDSAARESLSAALESLMLDSNHRLRWLRSENWHVTLRFIGDVSQRMVDALCIGFAEMTAHRPFALSLTQIEPFPSSKRPLVLAATGTAPAAALTIVEDLEALCRISGLPAETRPWRPHLTLARFRGRRAVDIEPICIDTGFTAQHLLLMESVESIHGRNYLPIAQRSLSIFNEGVEDT